MKIESRGAGLEGIAVVAAAWAVFGVAWAAVPVALNFNPFLAAGLVLSIVAAYFLLRGVRWLWFVMIGAGVLTLLTSPLISAHWYIYPLSVVWLVLLILPDTRRHFVTA